VPHHPTIERGTVDISVSALSPSPSTHLAPFRRWKRTLSLCNGGSRWRVERHGDVDDKNDCQATIRSKGRYAKLEGTCVRLAYLTWW